MYEHMTQSTLLCLIQRFVFYRERHCIHEDVTIFFSQATFSLFAQNIRSGHTSLSSNELSMSAFTKNNQSCAMVLLSNESTKYFKRSRQKGMFTTEKVVTHSVLFSTTSTNNATIIVAIYSFAISSTVKRSHSAFNSSIIEKSTMCVILCSFCAMLGTNSL